MKGVVEELQARSTGPHSAGAESELQTAYERPWEGSELPDECNRQLGVVSARLS